MALEQGKQCEKLGTFLKQQGDDQEWYFLFLSIFLWFALNENCCQHFFLTLEAKNLREVKYYPEGETQTLVKWL